MRFVPWEAARRRRSARARARLRDRSHRAERAFIMLGNDAGRLEMKAARAAGKMALPMTNVAIGRKTPEEVFATGRAAIVRICPTSMRCKGTKRPSRLAFATCSDAVAPRPVREPGDARHSAHYGGFISTVTIRATAIPRPPAGLSISSRTRQRQRLRVPDSITRVGQGSSRAGAPHGGSDSTGLIATAPQVPRLL